jgi:hypothetical protein
MFTFSKSSNGYRILLDLMIYLTQNTQHSSAIAQSSSSTIIGYGANTLRERTNSLSLRTIDSTLSASPMIPLATKHISPQKHTSTNGFGGLLWPAIFIGILKHVIFASCDKPVKSLFHLLLLLRHPSSPKPISTQCICRLPDHSNTLFKLDVLSPTIPSSRCSEPRLPRL